MTKIHLSEAVKIAGGQSSLARKINVKQAHVWKWLNTTRDGVPAEQVLPICNAISWHKTPHQLRPDLYPHPNDGMPEHMRVSG